MVEFWIICFIVSMMVVWFKTDALIDWGRLFGLYYFLKLDEFYAKRIQYAPSEYNYPAFLNEKYNNFFTKLLACPICLSFWPTLGASFFLAVILFDPLLFLAVPVTYVGALITYGIVTKLLK